MWQHVLCVPVNVRQQARGFFGTEGSAMNLLGVAGRGVAVAVGLVVFAAPSAHADGTMIPGGTIGAQLFKAGSGNLFVRYLGAQAQYTNDLYFYLTVGGANQFLFRNQTTAPGTQFEVTASSGLATGAEAIFSICANLAPAAPATGCTSTNQFYSGPASRNPDARFHAAVWTRDAWIAGCNAMPAHCNAAGLAALVADPSYQYVMGFEDSFNYNIDSDFNDVVFGVRDVSVVPEPITMTLLATGLAGMGGAGFLKRRRRTA